jgi:hypothetical protein
MQPRRANRPRPCARHSRHAPARLLAAALFVLVCQASPRSALADERAIPRTDTTAATPRIYGPLTILAVESRVVRTGARRALGNNLPWSSTERLALPAGTVAVLPVLSGWRLAYGDPPPPDRIAAPNDDHHFGIGHVDVSVIAFESAGTVVLVRTDVWLTDWNQDDRWWGEVRYHLFYLGPAPPPAPGPEPG